MILLLTLYMCIRLSQVLLAKTGILFQNNLYIFKLLIFMLIIMYDMHYCKCNSIFNNWKSKSKTKNLSVAYLDITNQWVLLIFLVDLKCILNPWKKIKWVIYLYCDYTIFCFGWKFWDFLRIKQKPHNTNLTTEIKIF